MTPIQLDPNHSVNTLADTTVQQAQANTLFAVRAEVATINAARVAEYDTQFAKYAASMDERPDATNIIAPVPAIAEVVVISESGWPFEAPGSEHVCPTKIWQQHKAIPPSWFAAGAQSTAPPEPFPGIALGDSVTLTSGRRFVRIA